jgi:hypothetical protein
VGAAAGSRGRYILDFGEDGFVGGFVGWVAARLLLTLCSLVPLGNFFNEI